MSPQRRELHTGSLGSVRIKLSGREGAIVVASLALAALAFVFAFMRHERVPAPPAPPKAELRFVPVPMPQIPVVAPTPVEPHRPTASIAARSAPTPSTPPPATTAPSTAPNELVTQYGDVDAAVPRSPPSVDELVTLYREVATTLHQLDKLRADLLWQRFRWIKLDEYLISPERRANAMRMLEAIASEARGQ
jgi:hypothetical protein